MRRSPTSTRCATTTACSVRSRRRPTVWRALDEVTPAALKRIGAARAKVRRHVWTLLPVGLPASPVAGTDLGEVVVLDVDATLVTAHSEKEQAAANFKGGFGFHPLGVWCDNTGELLADPAATGERERQPRRGPHRRARRGHRPDPGAASAQDAGPGRLGRRHRISCWTGSPTKARSAAGRWSTRSDSPSTKGSRSTTPSTPCPSRRGRRRSTPTVRSATAPRSPRSPDCSTWRRWPAGMRVIVRREKPHPGAGLTLFEQADGWRYQAFATNTAHRSAGVPGGPAPRPRPGRGPHPGRQRHRPGPVPVPGVHHQPGLDPDRRDRRRPDRLAATARPRRRPGQGRTQDAAVPDAARPRPPHPRRPPTPAPAPGQLALGRPDRRRVRHDHDHPRTHLTRIEPDRHHDQEPSETRTGAPPGTTTTPSRRSAPSTTPSKINTDQIRIAHERPGLAKVVDNVRRRVPQRRSVTGPKDDLATQSANYGRAASNTHGAQSSRLESCLDGGRPRGERAMALLPSSSSRPTWPDSRRRWRPGGRTVVMRMCCSGGHVRR